MQEEYADRVTIVGVGGSSDSTDALAGFVSQTGVGGFEHVADTDNSVWDAFGVFTQPTFAFVDDDGSVEVTRIGPGDLAGRIDALLAQ